MRCIETIHAEGHVLCHDITVIVKDVKKGVAFKKGHVVKKEDIPELLKLGKDHLYVWEKDDNLYHEDEAAEILRDICKGRNIAASQPHEGKIELTAEIDGLLVIDSERMRKVNAVEEIMIASRHGMTPVKAGDKLAGTRVIPLAIGKDKMEHVKSVAGDVPLMDVLPFKPLTVGIVTTGSEVYYGRIKDTFTPVIEQKVGEYGMKVVGHEMCPDDGEMITAAIQKLLDEGAQLILTTGGMSVDPDDRTPLAIRTLTVNWVDTEGNPLAEPLVQSGLKTGSAYSTQQKEFEGYTFQKTSGDAVSGVMTASRTVTYIYSRNAAEEPAAEPAPEG